MRLFVSSFVNCSTVPYRVGSKGISCSVVYFPMRDRIFFLHQLFRAHRFNVFRDVDQFISHVMDEGDEVSREMKSREDEGGCSDDKSQGSKKCCRNGHCLPIKNKEINAKRGQKRQAESPFEKFFGGVFGEFHGHLPLMSQVILRRFFLKIQAFFGEGESVEGLGFKGKGACA